MKGRAPWGKGTPDPPTLSFVMLVSQAWWRDRARCYTRPTDPRWFYPERPAHMRRYGHFILSEQRAKACCIRCPVRRECLSHGLYEEHGVWGGTLPGERAKLRHEPWCVDKAHPACVPDDVQVQDGLADMYAQALEYGLIDEEEDVA